MCLNILRDEGQEPGRNKLKNIQTPTPLMQYSKATFSVETEVLN